MFPTPVEREPRCRREMQRGRHRGNCRTSGSGDRAVTSSEMYNDDARELSRWRVDFPLDSQVLFQRA